jgi:hypothetical protein
MPLNDRGISDYDQVCKTFKNTSPLFPMTTPMYLPEMVSYDIAVIAKLMLWDNTGE